MLLWIVWSTMVTSHTICRKHTLAIKHTTNWKMKYKAQHEWPYDIQPKSTSINILKLFPKMHSTVWWMRGLHANYMKRPFNDEVSTHKTTSFSLSGIISLFHASSNNDWFVMDEWIRLRFLKEEITWRGFNALSFLVALYLQVTYFLRMNSHPNKIKPTYR